MPTAKIPAESQMPRALSQAAATAAARVMATRAAEHRVRSPTRSGMRAPKIRMRSTSTA